MTPDQIDLLEQYLDDTIAAPEMKRLQDLLGADDPFRKEFAEALRMQGLLHAGVGPDPSCDRLADIVSRGIPSGPRPLEASVMAEIRERGLEPIRRRWLSGRWGRVAAVVAAGWAVALGLWIALREPPLARLVAVSADVGIERGREKSPAAPGFALRAGDLVTVPLNGWARIRYEDATTLQIGSDTLVTLEGEGLPLDPKRVLVKRGFLSADVLPQPSDRPMVLTSPHAETRVMGTAFTLTVESESTRVLVRTGKVAFTQTEGNASVEVKGGHVATAARGRLLAAEPVRRELLRRIGKDRFMLGIMSELGEKWVDDTRAQGCRWDLRYQHLGADWTRWNANGGFVPLYLAESDRFGVLPVFTYYAMIRTPGQDAASVAAEIARTSGNASSMQKYFTDLRLFMQKAGAYGNPVILHVEPGVWAQFLSAPDTRPLEKIQVAVKSSGLPELEGLDDTAASFGKAFSILRDCHAPNVLLAWHASPQSGVAADAVAAAMTRCGAWDLIFTDVGDRDAGFKEARGVAGAWWKEKDFVDFREWGAGIHALTGLPLLVWRIPLGNATMAACNNTPWHYMDNRAEYWLEDYPSNRRIAEWAGAGFIGLLFGGGAVGCTVHRDNAKDGVTNPPPIAGNKGEQSAFPDDDGGYLRLRAGNYYKTGPLRLPGD